MIPRYSLPEMATVWSDERRLASWLEIELLAVEAWAERFLATLRALIAHCRDRVHRQLAGYSPADFPLTRLRQAELDHLLGPQALAA